MFCSRLSWLKRFSVFLPHFLLPSLEFPLDRQQVVQTNIGAGMTQDNVWMGAKKGDSRYFRGRIGAMQIYDVALTKGQVNAVKNAGQQR